VFPRLASIALAASLTAVCFAQESAATPDPQALSLHDILVRLQNNLTDYMTNVPTFYCNEQVISTRKQPGLPNKRTTTDSIFRLRRDSRLGKQVLTESREIKTVDGLRANGEELHGPSILNGVFSTGAGIVSLGMSRCFNYKLEPPGTLNKTRAIIISFSLKPEMLSNPSCPSLENQSGRAFIDPVTLHTERVETRIPNHQVSPSLKVLWTWVVDYAPVSFAGKQFWMPKKITSEADSNDGSSTWTFMANYSNYHKLTVSSHIITDVGDNPPPPQ
jgi:hypothetical protein